MITLLDEDMMLVDGGNAAEVWGEQAAASGLDHATSMNPLMWVPGVALAIAGAASYYGGWAATLFD